MGRIATGGCGIATTTCGCPRAVGASVTPGGLPSAETTPGRVARHGHLDLLYVTVGSQSKGTGRAIWTALQARYPEVEVWQTIAPYFEKRKPPLCLPPPRFPDRRVLPPGRQAHQAAGDHLGGMPADVGANSSASRSAGRTQTAASTPCRRARGRERPVRTPPQETRRAGRTPGASLRRGRGHRASSMSSTVTCVGPSSCAHCHVNASRVGSSTAVHAGGGPPAIEREVGVGVAPADAIGQPRCGLVERAEDSAHQTSRPCRVRVTGRPSGCENRDL